VGSVPVGRIVYTRQALPAVELVNFALIDGDIDGDIDGRRFTGDSDAHRQ
jgi:hypothetical protein